MLKSALFRLMMTFCLLLSVADSPIDKSVVLLFRVAIQK